MAVSTVHQCPACHGRAPDAPNVHSDRMLGARISKSPRERSAEAGSSISVAMYSTAHVTVTAFVKFHVRKICRSGPANPHMPGLRRPQTRHTGAEAWVSRPHEGQRIDPDVLRNIAVLVLRHSEALVEPHAEVDQAAGEGTEGAVRVAQPQRRGAARRAGHGALAHPVWIVRGPAKRVNSGTWPSLARRPSARVDTRRWR